MSFFLISLALGIPGSLYVLFGPTFEMLSYLEAHITRGSLPWEEHSEVGI